MARYHLPDPMVLSTTIYICIYILSSEHFVYRNRPGPKFYISCVVVTRPDNIYRLQHIIFEVHLGKLTQVFLCISLFFKFSEIIMESGFSVKGKPVDSR